MPRRLSSYLQFLLKAYSIISMRRFSLTTIAIILFFPVLGNTCTCRERTLADEFSSARAVFTGKVLFTDRSIQWKWMRLLSDFYHVTHITPPDYHPRKHGVSVTFRVSNSWKGQQEDIVTLITGYGRGDCGIPFEFGDEVLVFVKQYNPNWDDVSICSRTQPLEYAAGDLAALGPPMRSKLIHKSLAFHLIKQNSLSVVIFISFCTILTVYLKTRQKGRKV